MKTKVLSVLSILLVVLLIISTAVLSILLAVLLIISTAAPQKAQADSVKIIINGQAVNFPQQPVIKDGTTLVPMRPLFEALGAKVGWDQTTQKVTGQRGNITVELKIGSKTGIVNGQARPLSMPAQIIDGSTYIPLRFVGEALGDKVTYENGIITITSDPSNILPVIRGSLEVHYIDVGQADSIFIETPSGRTMLIDAGNNDDGDDVVSYIKSQGISKIDVLVGTHPHEDHIGGMDTVIESFDIGSVYMPKAVSNTETYEDVLDALTGKGLKATAAKGGMEIALDPALEADILAPNSEVYEDLNDYSAVIKLEYGDTSFLFTGDAEAVSEKEMLNAGYNLDSDVLKVGHHGSDSSTTPEFLKAVSPNYAVISVGKDNDYGHPSPEVVDRLNKAGVQVYRTDIDGTVTAVSNGSTISFTGQARPIPIPKPEPIPAPQPVPTKPVEAGIKSITEGVYPGDTASITIQGIPGETYSIKVMYSSGPSKASGLEPKKADSNGIVSWTWKVGTNTKPGTYDIIIEGGDQTIKTQFKVLSSSMAWPMKKAA